MITVTELPDSGPASSAAWGQVATTTIRVPNRLERQSSRNAPLSADTDHPQSQVQRHHARARPRGTWCQIGDDRFRSRVSSPVVRLAGHRSSEIALPIAILRIGLLL